MTTLNTIIEEEKKLHKWAIEAEGFEYNEETPLGEYSGKLDDFDFLLTTAMQRAYEAGEREAGAKIRDAYIKRISNHTGEFLNPWIPKTNLSHEELTHILNRLTEHLDTLLSKIRS